MDQHGRCSRLEANVREGDLLLLCDLATQPYALLSAYQSPCAPPSGVNKIGSGPDIQECRVVALVPSSELIRVGECCWTGGL